MLLLSSLSHAEAPDATIRHEAVGLGYSAGIVGFVGDLSKDRAQLVQEAGVERLFRRMRILKMLSFLFVANLCWRALPALEGCLGLGEGTVNINAPGNRRDYGTWNYAAEIDWNPLSRLWVVARGRFIGRVEQQVEGVDSEFSMYTATGGLAWRF